MDVKLITITPRAEETMAYIARVSSPHQDNPEYARLLKYCAGNKHWSVFEHAFATVEIVTSRMVSAQIIRHRSFSFSEFSQRYAEAMGQEVYEARRQDNKNRQNSIPDIPKENREWWADAQEILWENSMEVYRTALNMGIAKECARAVLPMNTQTRLYMTGSIRSWVHYLEVRCADGVQKEHRDIAVEIRTILAGQLPVVAEAVGWV